MLTDKRILFRLAALTAFLLIMLVSVGVAGLFSTFQMREELRTVYQDRFVSFGELSHVVNGYQDMRRELLTMTEGEKAALVASKKSDIVRIESNITVHWRKYLAAAHPPEEKAVIEAAKAAISTYDAVNSNILAKLDSSDFSAAKRIIRGQGAAAFDSLDDSLSSLMAVQQEIGGRQYAKTRMLDTKLRALLIFLLLVSLVGGATLAWLISRSITRPLTLIIGVMQKLTGGDLKIAIPGQNRRDEIGELARAVVIFKDSMIEADILRRGQEDSRFFATLNAAVEALPATVAVMNANAEIIFTDKKWQQDIQQLAAPSLGVGSNYFDRIDDLLKDDPKTRSTLKDGVLSVLEGRLHIFTMECDLTTAGQERRVLVTVTPLPVEAGGAVVMVLDMTERTKIENELKIRNEAMNSALTPITIADMRGNFTYVNQAFLDVWGFNDASQIIGRSGETLWDEVVDFEKASEEFLRLGFLTRELPARRLDGSLAQLLVLASIVKGPDGSPLSVISSYLDLTKRIAMEKALRESEQYNRTLFETSPIGLVLSRQGGIILDANSAYAEILGMTVAEVKARDCFKITPKEYVEGDERAFEYMMRTGHYGPIEKEYIRKDGERVPIRMQGSLIEVSGENCIWSSVEDISEQRKIDEQLRQSLKLQSLGTLAGGIAHEINNLLMPIVGLAELVRDNTRDESNIQNLDDILMATERVRLLVSTILAFSRRNQMNRKIISLEPTIKKIFELMRVTLPASVQVIFDINSNTQVNADENQIQQVIMNLCSNAIHAMGKKGGTLNISAENYSPEPQFFEKNSQLGYGKYVKITVSDTGHGMKPEMLPRIFEPFFTTKKVGEGTGLGLSVVHGIIESHGGVIDVESKPGAGTCFSIYLPAVAAAAESQRLSPRALHQGRL